MIHIMPDDDAVSDHVDQVAIKSYNMVSSYNTLEEISFGFKFRDHVFSIRPDQIMLLVKVT